MRRAFAHVESREFDPLQRAPRRTWIAPRPADAVPHPCTPSACTDPDAFDSHSLAYDHISKERCVRRMPRRLYGRIHLRRTELRPGVVLISAAG
jgi:hypothetical protein